MSYIPMISEVLHLLVELTPENRRRSFTQYFIKLSYANFIKYEKTDDVFRGRYLAFKI